MENIDFFSNQIKYVKGVGPAKSALFEKLNIFTVKDLVDNYPRVY